MSRGLPDPVRRLITEHIHSVEQLEVLLLLHRTPDRDWSAEEASAHIHTQTHSVAGRLAELHAQGFLDREDRDGTLRYRFSARSGRAADVAALGDCYARRRVTVISTIFSAPSENIRSFSDAFRLRGDG